MKQQMRKTARIYYGLNPETGERLYWTVKVRPADRVVDIDGTLLDAVRGERGTVIGCHLSNCAKRNADAFPHPMKLAAFTRSTCLIVTKLSRGQPSEAIKYSHSYGNLVELNDTKISKRYISKHPELCERQFRLRPPRRMRPTGRMHTNTGATPHKKRAFVLKGALRRAVDAGLVTPGLANMGFQ